MAARGSSCLQTTRDLLILCVEGASRPYRALAALQLVGP